MTAPKLRLTQANEPASAFPAYKVALPGIALHVRRANLQRRLTEAHTRAPVTWVMGLPGSGKTSAVAAWVRESGSLCFWYRLDDSDGDVAGHSHLHTPEVEMVRRARAVFRPFGGST
jgi:hypothetical protein